MTSLDLLFLGTFKVTREQEPVTKFRSANVRGLLVYLALRGTRPVERDRLATLFWPEESDQVAKLNLRQIIYHLRNALGDKTAEPPFLVVDRRTVSLNPNAAVTLDVQRFLDAVEQKDIEAAGILFSGELLPGFVCDSPDFEGWLRQEREKLNRIALDVLSDLAGLKLTLAEFAEAKKAAQKQLEIEPWREMAYYQLMQALALSGEREAAIAQFERLEQILESEMGISPQQETFDLVRQIENNELTASFNVAKPELLVPFQAPAVPEYLVGRDAEIEAISQLLTGPEERKEIVGLVGMGGIGKTTLAAAIGRKLKAQFSDGILWGNTLLSSAENILEVWAQAFGYDFSTISDLESLAVAVRGMLADKKVLIVLDNVSERLDTAPFLQPGSDCVMLLTTRSHDAASACGAHIVPVQELTAENSLSLIERVVERDRLLVDEEAQNAARQIGELLDHLPLAVEITAQLLKARPRLTLARMVERLKDSQQRRGLKISNKAVRASFELSWEFLNPELKTLFGIIGVFEGRSFTFEALQAIVETDPFDTEDDLYSLVSRSLVQLDGENRYKQHPLLADFAAEKLEQPRPILTKLIDFYLGFSEANALNYEGLQPEWDNMLAVIKQCHALEMWETLLSFTDILHDSWFRFGQYADANHIYALAETAAKKLGSEERLVKTLIRWSEMGLEQSDYDAVWERLETALPICYKLEDDSAVAQVKYLQAFICFDQSEYFQAEKLLQAALKIQHSQNNQLGEAKSFDLLGSLYRELDQTPERAEKLALKSLSIQSDINDQEGMISVLRLLAEIELARRNLDKADEFINKAIFLSQNINNQSELAASYFLQLALERLKENYDLSLNIGQRCLGIFQHLGNLRFEAATLRQIGLIHLLREDFLLAEKIMKEVLQLFQKVEDRYGYGSTLRDLGDIYIHLRKPEEGKKAWLEAREIAQFIGHSKLLLAINNRIDLEMS